MNKTNIFTTTTFFSLLTAAFLFLTACDRGDEYGTKTGDGEDTPEAYGVDDPNVIVEEEAAEDPIEDGEYPEENTPRGDVVAGEDNEAREVEFGRADTAYDSEDAMYPASKIQEDANLNSNDPLALDSDMYSVEKKKLLATLNRHATMIENRIRELRKQPGNSEDSSTVAGNIEKLKVYKRKLDLELAKVRTVNEADAAAEEVFESAQAAIKGAGAVMQSKDMRIQRGY